MTGNKLRSFVDIHMHTDLKTFLAANHEINRPDCWKEMDYPKFIDLIDPFFGNIFETQSSLKQLKKRRGNIGMVGLYSLEKAMVTGSMIFEWSPFSLKTLAKILNRFGKGNYLNYELLRRISSEDSSYFKTFNEMQTHLLLSQNMECGFNLLSDFRDYDKRRVNLVLAIEGGHNLFDNPDGSYDENEVLANLRKLKNGVFRYLSISPAHLARNPLCTHAYGMKIIYDNRFKPLGFGISDLGRKVITEALRGPRKILIDVKHMSLESRLQYYNILLHEYNNEIPVIMSHGGVTGVSYTKMPVIDYSRKGEWIKVKYYQPKGLLGTRFNPWSINLYDEEIPRIVDTGGLIGLSIDERILGTARKKPGKQAEYFSREEFNCPEKETIRKNRKNPENIWDEEGNDTDPDNDIRHLCNNILHIVKTDKRAWKHICLGSDFEGIVDATDGCRNVTKYRKLSRKLIKLLPYMAQEDPLLDAAEISLTIEQKVKDYMWGNARRFLKKYFVQYS